MQHTFEGVVGLNAPSKALGEARCADRHQHELLEIDVVVGVLAAVQHVHHWNGEHVSVRPADVAVERNVELGSRGVCGCERDAEDGVCATATLVGGSIGGDHCRVDSALGRDIHADDGFGEVGVDESHSGENALALVAIASVTEFDRLKLTGRCATRDERSARRTRGGGNGDLHGWVPAGVDYFHANY